MPSKSFIQKVLLALSMVGPGLFLIGYNIGTGSVTTMAKTGAEHGMSLFWALILSCLFTYILMVAYGQVTLVTGQTALYNFRTRWKAGWILALYIIIALIIGELLALMGVMGIVADLIQEGIRLGTGKIIPTAWIIALCAGLIYGLILRGKYKTFESVLTIFVILMGLSFLVVFILLRPDIMEIFGGMKPSIPDTPGALGLVAAIAGTTCSAAVFIMRSVVISEKGWTISDLKSEKKDAFVSASVMLILSGVIMAVGAGTLHVAGLKLDDTIEMIHLLEPLGGKISAFILIIGIAGAGLSTVFPIVLIAPWLIADFRGTPRNIQSKSSKYLIIGALLIAFGSVFLEQRPPALMIFSQAFQACILPAVAIPIYLMISDTNVMHHHKASIRMKIGVIMVIAFSFVTSYFAIKEFLN